MKIKVNGQNHELESPLTVLALTEKLNLNLRQVAVERNQQIVPRSQYGETLVTEGDQIEIVHFIGGG